MINYIYKIPIYSLLGVSICFIFSLIIIEIINYLSNLFNSQISKPLIHMGSQYSLILIISCLLGVIYGLIFSIMGLDDLSNNYLNTRFIKEQNFCIPIGIGFGCVTGYTLEYIRSEYSIGDYQTVMAHEEEI
jgi:hypothetical protein